MLHNPQIFLVGFAIFVISCTPKPAEFPAEDMPIESLQERNCVELKNLQLEVKSRIVNLNNDYHVPLRSAGQAALVGQVINPALGAVSGIDASVKKSEIDRKLEFANTELQAINGEAERKDCWEIIGK